MGASLALAAAAAFNLVCSGTETYSDNMAPSSARERPFSVTYRVDLNAGRWCSGECPETLAIYRVTERQITLTSNEAQRKNTVDWIHIDINRESGRLSADTVLKTSFYIRDGQCRPAPFAGFPTRKF
jgi:hypothetical protein